MAWTDEEFKRLKDMNVDTEYFEGVGEHKLYKLINKTSGSGKWKYEYLDVENQSMNILPKFNNMNCCGMREISTFPAYPSDEVIERIDWFIQTYEEQLKDDYYKDSGSFCFIATLSEEQKRWWKILEEKGWKKAHSFINVKSQNEVRLYVYNLVIE